MNLTKKLRMSWIYENPTHLKSWVELNFLMEEAAPKGSILKSKYELSAIFGYDCTEFMNRLYQSGYISVSKDGDKMLISLPKYKNKVVKCDVNIGDRYESFARDVYSYENVYDTKMLDRFFDYWSESDGKKMKFEKQKTWELKLRLKTWYERSKEFSSNRRERENGINNLESLANRVLQSD